MMEVLTAALGRPRTVKDRVDHEANAMQEAVDPHAMLEALERASEGDPPENT